jgi:MraZ protein
VGKKPLKVGDFMFDGEYKHTIDSKGRLMIPSKYRDVIAGEELCILTAFSDCLSIYPKSTFREHTRGLTGISSTDRKRMRMKRYILSNTRETDLDPQGRILVSKEQREKAGLGKEVIIVGMDDYFEVWDPERYAEESIYGSNEEMADEAFELGFTL